MSTFVNKGWRSFFIYAGLILGWTASGFLQQFQDLITNEAIRWVMLAVGILFSLFGCYIWLKLKNRHWAFTFWGILTPIGLLGVSLLKDKSIQKTNTQSLI
jgi:hypothetical protein